MTFALAVLFIVTAVLLLLFAGAYAAAEAALLMRSRSDLARLAENSKRVQQALYAIVEAEDVHLGAANLARVSCHSLAAVLLTLVIAYSVPVLWLALLLAAAVLGVATFVLVGVSPRKLGRSYPNPIIYATAPLIRVTGKILGPLVLGLQRFSSSVTVGRASGLERDDDAENQLLSLVDRAAENEVLESEDRDYIHSLVRFNEMRVRETMVPRPDMFTVTADTSMRETLDALLAARHSRMPVIAADADDVLGVIHLRDTAGFVHRYPEEADTAPVTRMMKQAMFLPELVYANQALEKMREEKQHLALTVDEYGGISGLVTLEDLLEELVGDIYDEHDRNTPEVIEQEDGSFELSPRLTVLDFGQLFAIGLEDADVDTVGGLFVKELGRLANQHDTVRVHGIKLTATRVDRRHNIHSLHAVLENTDLPTESDPDA